MKGVKNMATINKKQLIGWIISFALAVVPFLIPVGGLYTAQMRIFLAVTLFCIAVIAFELMHTAAVALLMPVGWCLTGSATFAQAFSAWSSSNVWIALGAMIFMLIVQNTGLLTRLGLWAIIKAKANFSSMIWMLFFACNLVTFVGFGMAALLGFALAFTLYTSLKLKPTDRESIVIVLTALLGTITSVTYVYCPISVSLINASAGAVMPGFNLLWYEILLYCFPVLFINMFTIWLFLLWYKRGKKSESLSIENALAQFQKQKDDLGVFSLNEKKATVLLSFIAVYMCTQPFHGLDAAYGFILGVIIAFLPGVNLGTTACVKEIPWDNIFLVASFLSLGTIATALGFNNIAVTYFAPLVAQMGEYWSLLGTLLLGSLANFVVSPFAMLALLPAPIVEYCNAVGYEVMGHIMSFYIARDIVFLPYEYPGYLILFSFGMIKMPEMIKVCTIKTLILLAGFIVVLMPFWKFVVGIV